MIFIRRETTNKRRDTTKKLLMFTAVLAMLALAVVPALAAQRGDNDRDHRDRNDRDRQHFFARDRGGIPQESEQESDSGDVDQSFDVSNTGDNSDQCVGIQGAANTGNAQNQTSLIQYGSEADDFEFDEVGSTITVSPENSTSCDQQVNQAASATGS
jgi:uncharacterized membrane protein YkoI